MRKIFLCALMFGTLAARPARPQQSKTGPRMGLGAVINFQKDGSGAATTGDFVLLAAEVQPVIRALRANGIDCHRPAQSHAGRTTSPFFLHFWGRGPEVQLGQALRAAWDATNHQRAP